MLFPASETSQPDERVSAAFFLQSSTTCELFPWLRALCFLDHLVTVTLSSTCTSLVSDLEEGTLCSSTIGRTEGVEVENDGFLVGDE